MQPIIQIQNLSFSYPDGHRALKDVHLEVYPGEKVAAVGPNGAGKSTLLLHLNGILRGRGKVSVAGLEVNSRNARAVRAQVGLIFLDPPTFSNSKRMSDNFDLQRDHVQLIRRAVELLEEDGLLIFSNNFRRFKMDLEGMG